MGCTQAQLREHFLKLEGAIYLWGANGQTITRVLVDMLHSRFGNSKYNKDYYDNKLKEGIGKIGADCSGALCQISGYDTTASGYYKKCVKQGGIASIPMNKVCLVFKMNSTGDITHVGCYTGDGYVSEMASSKLNYQRKALEGNGWDLWGMPDFITDPESVMSSDECYPKYTGKSSSLDTILKAVGVPATYYGNYKKRVPLAEANGISNYRGSSKDNSTLKSLAKKGRLKKVVEDMRYYPKYNGLSNSINKVLKDIGVPEGYRGSIENRRYIARVNGYPSDTYTGKYAQNINLCKLAKQGKLVKP